MANESLFYIGVKAILRNPNGRLLLLQTTTRNLTYWELPGGRISEGEAPLDTLRRELGSELGIAQITILRPVVMALSGVRMPAGDGKNVGIVFDVYLCSTETDQLKLESNMGAKWCTAAAAAKLLRTNRDYPLAVIDAVAGIS